MKLAEVLAQRHVKCIYRAVALACIDERLARHSDFHHGFGNHFLFTLFDNHAEGQHVEIFRHVAKGSPCEKFKRRIRAIIGIANGLALLHFAQEIVKARIIFPHLKANAVQLCHQIGFSGLVRHQHTAAIAHGFRRHMLVGFRFLDDGRGVDTRLGGECAFANVRRLRVGRTVQEFIKCAGHMGQILQSAIINADAEAVIVGFFQTQCCDDRYEICISAAFTNAVQCSLHVAHACINGGERIGHRLIRVVVGVDAEV